MVNLIPLPEADLEQEKEKQRKKKEKISEERRRDGRESFTTTLEIGNEGRIPHSMKRHGKRETTTFSDSLLLFATLKLRISGRKLSAPPQSLSIVESPLPELAHTAYYYTTISTGNYNSAIETSAVKKATHPPLVCISLIVGTIRRHQYQENKYES